MELSLEITCFGIHCITTSKRLLEITSLDAWNVQVVQNFPSEQTCDKMFARNTVKGTQYWRCPLGQSASPHYNIDYC